MALLLLLLLLATTRLHKMLFLTYSVCVCLYMNDFHGNVFQFLSLVCCCSCYNKISLHLTTRNENEKENKYNHPRLNAQIGKNALLYRLEYDDVNRAADRASGRRRCVYH